MNTQKLKQTGFTIVELLIVIVVIGILAAITIVSYSGIQTRAKNTQIAAAMDAYEKALRQYKTFNNTYPSSISPGKTYACLGGDFPQKTPFNEGECFNISDGTVVAVKVPAVDAALKTVLSSPPEVTNDAFSYPYGTDGRTATIRGIVYTGANDYALIAYGIKGDQTCARGFKSTIGLGTVCQVSLD